MKKSLIIVISIYMLFSCETAKDLTQNQSTITSASIENINEPNTDFKILPDPLRYPIVPPDMSYRYFENYLDYPFEPNNTEFSIVNSWWLSECAFLAYAHPGYARMAYELAGFDNFKYFESKSAECMVSWNDDTIIVSFRGTELKSNSALYDIAADLNTIPTKFELGGMVHKGFLETLNDVWFGVDGLQVFIKNLIKESPDKPLWVTGHSLGGALAALFYTRMPTAKGLYLFGTPRIGDNEFINISKGRPIWRFENYKDPIVKVPLNLPALKFYFGDIGQLVYLSEDDQIKFDKNKSVNLSDYIDNPTMTLSDFVKQRRINTNIDITDHMPIYYTSKIWNHLIEANEVLEF